MDFASIYYVSEASKRGACRATPVDDAIGNRAADLTGGLWTPPQLLRFRVYEGKKLHDLVGTQLAIVELFSDRVFAALEAAKVTGWTTYPVHLETKDGLPVPGYRGLVVTGRCGRIDNKRSVPFDRPMGGGLTSVFYRGLYFDETQWDGTNIFRPEGTGYVFMTQKAKDALTKIKVTNFDFVPLAEFERAVLPREKGST